MQKVFNLWSTLRRWYAPIFYDEQSINSLETKTVSFIKSDMGSTEKAFIYRAVLSLLQNGLPSFPTIAAKDNCQ